MNVLRLAHGSAPITETLAGRPWSAGLQFAANLLARLRGRLLDVPDVEASFARRGFHRGADRSRERLEQIGRAFLGGYRAALEEDTPVRLASRLEDSEPELRGFAYEGAGMGLYLLDRLTPWRRGRFREFLSGPGAAHTYMLHVGAGWAVAQLRRDVQRARLALDPLVGWLAIDGFGFYHGYFRWPAAVVQRRVPARLDGRARRVFDQGLGRSLWFVEGADVERIAARVAGFPAPRRADLWSGVGLACAYAGGATAEALGELGVESGPDFPHLAQGVSFAAAARERAGNPAWHTDVASRLLCGMPATAAARLCEQAAAGLDGMTDPSAYEEWRSRIRRNWTTEQRWTPTEPQQATS